MKNKKLNIILYIIVFIFVFIMFLATTYAYYKRVIKKDESPKEVNTFNMLVMFDTGNVIDIKNPKKGSIVTKNFTIDNFSEDTIGKYNIEFEIISPLSNMVDEDFTYSLEGISNSKDNSNKVLNVSDALVPVLSKEIGNGVITPKNTHSYKLTVMLNNNKYVKKSLFNAVVKITIDN